MPEDLHHRIAAIRQAHSQLPRPDVVGRPMGIRHEK
jgi:hypothetical protein